jgi:hypothetical protein
VSLLLAFAVAQAAAVAEPAASDDIVVLAQKLKNTRFVWKASDKSGAWKLKSCKIKQSSGDKEIDAITCRATEQCLSTLPLGAKTMPPAFTACLTDRRSALIAELAARRSAAKDAEQ